MIIKTSYNDLHVGETARLYLTINDLYDSNGQKIHLEEIKKVCIEKLDNSHIEPYKENIQIRSFYGSRNVYLKSSLDINFLNFFSLSENNQKNLINLLNGNYYVKISSPNTISGFYKIIDIPTLSYDNDYQPQSNVLIISGVFSEIPDGIIEFVIVDYDYNNISVDFIDKEATISFDENLNYFSPLWKKDLYYFECFESGCDFSTIPNLSSCTLQISTDNVNFDSYPCLNLYKSNNLNVYNSFFIVGFNNSNYNFSDIFYWKILDKNLNEITIGSHSDQKNGYIKSFYSSPISFETYTTEENNIIYRYYLDWFIEDNFNTGSGSYIAYWYYLRQGSDIYEIFQNTYLIYEDFEIPEVFSRKFTRENYYQILEKHLPFFYIDYQANDVLNQTLRAFGESIYDVQEKADQFPQLLDPSRCHLKTLPYLSNLFSYRLKGNGASVWRRQLVNLPKVLKQKGTARGLIRALQLIGVETTSIIFYWQVYSDYLWTDYFFLKNKPNTVEYHNTTYSPLIQYTQDGYDIFGQDYEDIIGINNLNYSRYKIEYYSVEKEKWFDLFPIYDDKNHLIYDLFDLVYLDSSLKETKTEIYKPQIGWNFYTESQEYYIEYKDKTGIFDNIEDDFYNEISLYQIHIIFGNVINGLYEAESIEYEDHTDPDEYRLIKFRIKYYGESENLFINKSLIVENIEFNIMLNGTNYLNYSNLKGIIRKEVNTVNSTKNKDGKIIGKDKISGKLKEFTPKENDILKFRYQYNKYPYEMNSSSSDYLINFDNYSISKDDFIISLPLLDNREPIDKSYYDNKLIPYVNYNTRLLPDSTCYVSQNEMVENLICLDEYNICDVCSKRNALHEPLIYGYIRTKFPWSENVYNMEEYDGSIRPSYNPCDIDETFKDKCKCCWSSYFSISLNVQNFSDKMTKEINDLIKEFKPFHSNVKNISYSSQILDTVRIDSNISLNIINQYQDVTTIGYYPIDQEINEFQKRKKSESYFFADAVFETKLEDLKENVCLYDINVSFNSFPIGTKQEHVESLLPVLLNVNLSRVVIESPIDSGEHGGKSYNISKIYKNQIRLCDGTDDGIDDLPDPPYSHTGPWVYSIYTRRFPQAVSESPNWPGNISVSVIKSGKFIIYSNIDLLENGDIVNFDIKDDTHIYTVYINSGATIGEYNIEYINNNIIVLGNYEYGYDYDKQISFSIYKDGNIIESLDSISGYLKRDDVYGEVEIDGISDFISEWNIIRDSFYACIDDRYYYKIINVVNNKIKFNGYANGTDGIHNFSIFEKCLSSNFGYITSSTDIIYAKDNCFNFYNIIYHNLTDTKKLNDILIGILFGDEYLYYNVSEIYDDNYYKIKINELSIEEVISSQLMKIRMCKLTEYKENSVYPNTNELINILEGTATGGSEYTLEDTEINFDNYYIKAEDLVIRYELDIDLKEINYSWAQVESVSGSIITFSDDLQQDGSYTGSFSDPNSHYRIIRRNIYDYNLDVPKSDIVNITIDPNISNLKVPVNNILEIVPGTYDIKINSEDDKNTILVKSDTKYLNNFFIIGPVNTTHNNYYKVVNKIKGEQVYLNIYYNYLVIGNDINVYVNGKQWHRVEKWTKYDESPGNIGLKEYIVKRISDHEIKIYFGDGITGHDVYPEDVIEVVCDLSGYFRGPINVDKIQQNETINLEVENIYTGGKVKINLSS